MKRQLLLLLISQLFLNAFGQDYVVKNVTIPETVVSGDWLNVQGHYINQDSVATQFTYLKFYLSTDTLLDPFDDWILSDYRNATSGVDTSIIDENASIPEIPEGDYYLLVMADANHYVTETNESNNLSFHPFSVVSLAESPYDFNFIELSTTEDTLSTGVYINSNIRVANNGDSARTDIRMHYYLSYDSAYDEQDKYLDYKYIRDTLFPGDTLSTDITYIDNDGLVPEGNYYLIARLDPNNAIKEIDETNNEGIIPVYALNKNDFYGNNPVLKTSGSIGSYLDLTCQLHSAEGGNSQSIIVNTYLSEDTIYDHKDYLLSDHSIYFSSGSYTNFSLETAVPDIDHGNYHVLLSLDHTNRQEEINEDNNIVVAGSLAVTPGNIDLVCDSIQIADTGIMVGQDFDTDFYFSQTGTDTAGRVNFCTFLSADDKLDVGDYQLEDSWVEFSNDGKATKSLTLDTETFVPNGNYYVLVAIDMDEDFQTTVTETDETNNVLSHPVIVSNDPVELHDFEITSIELPGNDSVFAPSSGEYIRLYYTNNSPTATTNYTYTAVYLSKDTTYDYNDIFITSDHVTAGIGNDTYSERAYINLPPNTDTGIYYLIGIVNNPTRIFESDYTNNTMVSTPIQVVGTEYDLEPAELILSDTSLFSDEELDVTVSVMNNGGDDIISNFYVTYYLSEDSVLDGMDVNISTLNVQGGIESMATKQVNNSLTLPNGYTSANYLLVDVDKFYYDAVNETNDNNNFIKSPISIAERDFDWEITAIEGADSSIYMNDYYDVTIQNNGTTYSPVNQVHFLMAKDSTYTGLTSFMEGSTSLPEIAPGESETVRHRVYFSNMSIPHGNYYVMARVDHYENHDEPDEENNHIAKPVVLVEQLVDLTPVDVFFPDTVYKDNAFETNASVAVTGNYSPSYCNVWYYLSEDANLDPEEDIVLEMRNFSLEVNDTSEQYNINLTIPDSIETGQYTLFIEADPSDNIEETNEDNNIYAKPVVLIENTVDLVPSESYLSSTERIVGWNLGVYTRVVALGNFQPGAIQVEYYLSSDSVFNPEEDDYMDYQPYDFNGNDTTEMDSETFEIPIDYEAGDYYVFIVVDALNSVAEINEQNNAIGLPITISREEVDHVITWAAFAVSDTIIDGHLSKINYKIKNVGIKDSPRSTELGVYFSSDTIWDEDDYFLEGEYVSALDSGSVDSSDVLVSPENMPLGNNFILLKADSDNEIGESNESNNVFALPVYMKGDKSVFQLTQLQTNKEEIPLGTRFHYSMEVTNIGTNKGGFGTALYLSEDGVYDIKDTKLHETIGNVLDQGSTQYFNHYLNCPPVDTGTYYLLAMAGPHTFNLSANAVTMDTTRIHIRASQVDLTNDSLSLPVDTVNAGDEITVAHYYKNAGIDTAGLTYIGYYLSADSSCEVTDDYLHGFAKDQYVPDFEYSRQPNLDIPSDLPTGKYYIGAFVDFKYEIAETNESNNVILQPLYVNGTTDSLPDLYFENLSLSDTVLMYDENFYVYYDLVTPRPVNTYFYVKHYLSRDTLHSDNDIYIDRQFISSVDSLRSTNTYIHNFNKIMRGEYYLLSIIDEVGKIMESSESNNFNYQKVWIDYAELDYFTDSISMASDSVYPGEEVDFEFYMHRSGIDYTRYIYHKLLLSKDTTLDALDYELTEDRRYFNDSLEYVSEDGMIPEFSPGNYYLLHYVDSREEFLETDESNNVYIKPITIHPSQYDVGIESITLQPNELRNGDTLSMDVVVANQGNAIEGEEITYRVYLSADEMLDDTDEMIFDFTTDTLPEGGNDSAMFDLPIDGMDYEIYYVIAQADMEDEIFESDEDNNVLASAFQVLPPEVDFFIDDINLSHDSLEAMDSLIITVVTAYTGTFTGDPLVNRLYLSVDEAYDGDDILLHSYNTELSISDSSDQTYVKVEVPNVEAGSYHILAYCDGNENKIETDETNNIMASEFQVLSSEVDFFIDDINLSHSSLEAMESLGITVVTAYTGTFKGDPLVNRLYLSVDEAFDTDDMLLHAYNTELSASDSSDQTYVEVEIPDVEAGSYHILAYCDGNENKIETDETNNVMAVALTVESNPVDIELESLTLDAGDESSDTLYISFVIGNTGAKDISSAFDNAIYLSDDNTLDQQDLRIAIMGVDSLSISETVTLQSHYMKNAISSGQYIIVSADNNDIITEVDENNNLLAEEYILNTTDIESMSAWETGIHLYPNPAVSEINIHFTQSVDHEIQMVIADVQGKVRKIRSVEYVLANEPVVLDVSELPEGVYLLRIRDGKEVTTHKLMIGDE